MVQIDDQVAAARQQAETQAAVEAEALRRRIHEMEAYVEEADARALQHPAAAAAQLAPAAVGGRATPDADAWAEVRAAEERADALSLELQYAHDERRQAQRELEAARADKDKAVA